MNANSPLGTCRCCTHYQPEGRRGGTCEQLGVPVKSCWQACSLAVRPFASLSSLDGDIARLETTLTLAYAAPVPAAKPQVQQPVRRMIPKLAAS
ncbi:MAG: hypothetical protein HC910_06000 [Spirulinaceae cyanobacterium SM2_1_0]|nr:hypothetical protein [Spirulinaceae cyanobacterium SM2_1_0]